VLVRVEEAMALWREGERRFQEADPEQRPALDRATAAIFDELNRRLGGPFTLQELADLYSEQGTDWCFDLASRAAPGDPAAWDIPAVAGMAFARYARRASDYRPVSAPRPPGMEPA
jgi:hypothetical protein